MKSNRFVAKIVDPATDRKVGHYAGLPPQLTDGVDTRERFGPPVLLLIEEESDGAALYRYTADGQLVGDTFHDTLDDARGQARFEYGETAYDWKEVPDGIDDPVSFGLKNA